MPDFRSLSEAAVGPDVFFRATCNDGITRSGSCFHEARWSIVYAIVRFGPQWRACDARLVCSYCGSRSVSYGFSHPARPFGNGHGEWWPALDYHRAIRSYRWGRYLNEVDGGPGSLRWFANLVTLNEEEAFQRAAAGEQALVVVRDPARKVAALLKHMANGFDAVQDGRTFLHASGGSVLVIMPAEFVGLGGDRFDYAAVEADVPDPDRNFARSLLR